MRVETIFSNRESPKNEDEVIPMVNQVTEIPRKKFDRWALRVLK